MRIRTGIILLTLIVVQATASQSQVIINEVLANEPGGYQTLEWIELFNNSGQDISLTGYELQESDNTPEPLGDVEIPVESYLIVCRKLITSETSRGFEDNWGDSSNVWGDTYEESLLLQPIEMSFSLRNSGDTVRLLNPTGSTISEFIWVEDGKDGYSWERVSPMSSIIEQAIDPSGSTPGFINSLTPVDHDLLLNLELVQPDNGWAQITLVIVNTGNDPVFGSHLVVNQVNLSDTVEIEKIALPSLNPSQTFIYERRYLFYGYYASLTASLSDDDRLSNNVIEFVVPGSDYPPITLSEFLANPVGELETEWLEIHNLSDETYDLTGWQLGDSLSLRTIADTIFEIPADEYVVLAKDAALFLDFYSDFSGPLVEIKQWPTLNNNDDLVRLVCPFGFEADRFSYSKIFSNNHTWCKSEDTVHFGEWGHSENEGGTPGARNVVFFGPGGSSVNITISPGVFSPDGDGIDEFTTITVEAPADEDYEMKIYDRQGREIYAFDQVRDENTWYGETNGGNRVSIGIYILYFEVIGGESVREAIIVAR